MNSYHRCDIVFGPGCFCDAAGEETLSWVLMAALDFNLTGRIRA